VKLGLCSIRQVTILVCYLHLRCRNIGCSCSQSRTTDQMCRQQSRGPLTAEEVLAAEESLSVYCKPVELYNILHRRSIRNVKLLSSHAHLCQFPIRFPLLSPFKAAKYMHLIPYVFCCSHHFSRDVCITRYKRSTNEGSVSCISVYFFLSKEVCNSFCIS